MNELRAIPIDKLTTAIYYQLGTALTRANAIDADKAIYTAQILIDLLPDNSPEKVFMQGSLDGIIREVTDRISNHD